MLTIRNIAGNSGNNGFIIRVLIPSEASGTDSGETLILFRKI